MTDPERLLHTSPGGLSARLLRAGIDEAPSKQSLERTLVAVGAATSVLGAAGTAGALGAGGAATASAASTAGALGAAGAGKAATALTLVSLAKWAGMGVAGGVAVSLAAQVTVVAPAPSQVPTPAPVVVMSTPARVESPEERAAPPAKIESAEPAPSAQVEPRATTAATAPSPSIDDAAGAPLAAEVTFVDRGRALFQRGDATGALGALAGYERTFREPRLMPEVLYLRMEATLLAGDKARANDIARRVVRVYGKGPHAARARAILSAP